MANELDNNPIVQSLRAFKGGVQPENIQEGASLSSQSAPAGQPSGGTVATARRLRQDEDTMAGKVFVHKTGDLKGVQEMVDYTIEQNGRYSVIFKSGVQMLMEQVTQEMVQQDEYDSSVRKTDGLSFEDEVDIGDIKPGIYNQQHGHGQGQLELPPEASIERDNSKIEGLEYVNPPTGHPGIVRTQQPTAKSSPIIDLLEKMKSGPVDVDLKLKLNIPSKEVYNMLVSTFDGADQDIIEYIFTGKNFRDLKNEFIEALNNYYGVVKPLPEEIVEDEGNWEEENPHLVEQPTSPGDILLNELHQPTGSTALPETSIGE